MERAMSVARESCSKVTRFIKKLRGGSQPILVEADDHMLYVVKFADNLQGANLLFNESMGIELYRACGLMTTFWKPLLLTNEFLDRYAGAWIETENGLRRPSEGICLGLGYLGAANARIFEILPASAFYRICNRADFWLSWLVDICAEHTDNRQALFTQCPDGLLLSYFIDHGYLFGGASGNAKTHFVGSRYLDSRIYPSLSSIRLAALVDKLVSVDKLAIGQRLSLIPDEWKTASALDGLERCLERFANRTLLRNLLETIVDSVVRRSENDDFAGEFGHKTRAWVLRAGVQSPIAIPGYASYRTDRFICGQG
jgi:hypothetical protein